MLYFISEKSEQNIRHRIVNHGIRRLLREKKTVFREIDAHSFVPERLESREEDVWLLGDAHSNAACRISGKPGRKFAHLHSHTKFCSDPAALFDGLFAFSYWDKNCLLKFYPALSTRVNVCGFPFYPVLQNLRVKKVKGLVIFNQPFCPDNLHILEVSLTESLHSRGCRIIHLSPESDRLTIQAEREASALMQEGIKRGMEFIFYTKPIEYYMWLSRAEVTVVTPSKQTDVFGIVEASALGAFPVAPRLGPFPEFLPESSLYPPYNLEAICQMVSSPLPVRCSSGRFSPNHVFNTYTRLMVVR